MTDTLASRLSRLSELMKDSQAGPYRVAPEIEVLNAQWEEVSKGSEFKKIQTALAAAFGSSWRMGRFRTINRALQLYGNSIVRMMTPAAAVWAVNQVADARREDFLLALGHAFNRNNKNPLCVNKVRHISTSLGIYSSSRHGRRHCQRCLIYELRIQQLEGMSAAAEE